MATDEHRPAEIADVVRSFALPLPGSAFEGTVHEIGRAEVRKAQEILEDARQ